MKTLYDVSEGLFGHEAAVVFYHEEMELQTWLLSLLSSDKARRRAIVEQTNDVYNGGLLCC